MLRQGVRSLAVISRLGLGLVPSPPPHPQAQARSTEHQHTSTQTHNRKHGAPASWAEQVNKEARKGASVVKSWALDWPPRRTTQFHNAPLIEQTPRTDVNDNEMIEAQNTTPSDNHIWVNFPRTGKMVEIWHFSIFWSSAVTKRFDFFNFSQLFWRNFVRYILKILSFWSKHIFLI